MQVFCLGDSLTYGYGVSREDTWPMQSQLALGGEWINAGINGDTADGMLSRLVQQLTVYPPNYALLMGGINDILLTGAAQSAKRAMMSMVHQCSHFGVRPVVGIPIPLEVSEKNPWLPLIDWAAAEEAHQDYIAWLRLFVSTMRLRCVDFYSSFEGFASERKELYLPDGLHPNETGHLFMSQAVINSRIWT